MSKKEFSRNEGMALFIAMFFVVITIALAGTVTMRVMNQKRFVDLYAQNETCFLGVDAGLEASMASLDNSSTGMVGFAGQLTRANGRIVPPTFASEGVSPRQLPNNPDIEYFSVAQSWSNDGVDNNGDSVIDGPEEFGRFTLFSNARDTKGNQRQVEAVLSGSDVNVWNNAIFAGAGHVSGAINGNCSIHGSVHILGNEVPEGNESIIVLDLMGASLIHNHYGAKQMTGPMLTDALQASLPPLVGGTTNTGETNQEDLGAKLRVKNGLVSLNSSSEVGHVEVAGNSLKDTMLGTYNTDGWTGQRVVNDGGRGDPTVVYSDNGWDEGYDLGDRVPFPELSDDWRWPAQVPCHELGYEWTGVPGSTETSPDGDPYTHSEFFGSQLSDGAPYSGNVTIKTDTSFYLNLTRGGTNPAQRVKPSSSTCTKGDDYIYYNKDTKVLEINGQVEINGSLLITPAKGGSASTIYYSGRSALLVHGGVEINTSLLACNNSTPTNTARSFPENNCFGIMTDGDMYLGRSSQLQLQGAFYAQGQVKADKQCTITGTFVSSFFDMGSQVPDIYQVPELPKYLPLGMVANYPLLSFHLVSWRELAAS